MSRVIVVGAGISGLAAATFLRSSPNGPDEVRVLEAGARPGGNVQTTLQDGHTIDHAANGWLNSEPAMSRLLELAGLTDQRLLCSDLYDSRWIYADGAKHAAPMSPGAMASTQLINFGAKLRLMLEPFIGRGPADQTVGQFVRRRLGPAFVDRMVGPMVAGIYAADPDKLELAAAFPRMAHLETEYRSLFIAMLKLRRGGAPPGRLETLPGGAGALTEKLAADLGERLRCDTPVKAVERRRSGWMVHTETDALPCDGVILACPGHVQARLVRGVDGDAADALDAIPYAPAAVVVSSWPKGAFAEEPNGFGVLMARDASVPGAEGVLGAVFSSCVFPDQAPADRDLTRVIIGGSVYPDAAAVDEQELTGRARTALSAFLGENQADPSLVRIFRHPKGIPQYSVGHLRRVKVVRAAQSRHPGLIFAGNHLQGIGVKDCARAGEDAAAEVSAALGLEPQV
jgi:protoporphyrinogen/coproporphyrinogen III oxidase